VVENCKEREKWKGKREGGVGRGKEKVTYLQVFHWVPVVLHKDNRVGTSQV